MAAQSTDKKTTDISEEQNAIRRAKKAKQKQSTRQGPSNRGGYLAGLASDRLKQRGATMLDRLDTVMTSSSAQATEELRHVMVVYVDGFTAENGPHNEHQRHMAAKKPALGKLTGPLRVYAERQLDAVLKATRHQG